jgi:PTS system mannose-specific IIC component
MVFSLSLGALVSLICGLDRVAILQVMISRPIVAAPLVALLLGEPLVGLQIGVMVELLWLARLPVGAAVPPDDTQVAIATSVLTVIFERALNTSGIELILLCLLIATPLGKVGQYFDHYARQYNVSLATRVDTALDQGALTRAEFLHLRGLVSFTLAALGTYAVIMAGGLVAVPLLWPLIQKSFGYSTAWVELALPLIGVAVVLGTINVSRAITLFCASFCMAFLLMWLV